MARRKQLTAEVKVRHANGDVSTSYDFRSVASVRVAIPELDWLHAVQINLDPKTGEVAVRIEPSAENAPNAPQLKMRPDGFFQVTS